MIIKIRQASILLLCAISIICVMFSCSDQISGSFFKGQYPHQRYDRQLRNAGLEESIIYRRWHAASLRSLADPTDISIPHQEMAYIAHDDPTAIGYSFSARQGERLQIQVVTQTTDSVQLFMDLFEASQDTSTKHKHIISADTGTTTLTWDIRRDGNYILRVQPELFAELSFKLQLTVDPSLANPVAATAKQHIGSVFGDTRDGGKRSHEGIDIFAARHTPVVAAADGIVRRVGDNQLGGKVVWLRLTDRTINLYYAHLDSQLVTPGQLVKVDDTLGLMGNTGNARTTPPHLHFGIYAAAGAVDPLPFVRPNKSVPPKITIDTARIGDTVRTTAQTIPAVLRHVPAHIEAAYKNGYRVVLPDNSKIFLNQKQIVSLSSTLRSIQLSQQRILYARPDTLAAQITTLQRGDRTNIIAEYNGFLLVEGPIRGWVTVNE